MRITCFWAEPTGRQHLWLRRYRSSAEKCSGPHGYHNARTFYVDAPLGDRFAETGVVDAVGLDLAPPKGDQRWPAACACGETFKSSDEWQVFNDVLYRRADAPDFEPFALDDAPPGAMWDARWWPDKGPDGIALAVKTPAGVWMPDVQREGGAWTRTGTLPCVTIRPSILFPGPHGYHGFLTDGVLESC